MGGTGGGHILGYPERYMQGLSSAKDFQEISLSVIRLTLP